MFLRGPLTSRVLPAALRLCNSPSTSTFYSSFSRASSVLSRCNNHVIATSTPQLARHFGSSVISTQVGNDKKGEEVKGARIKHTDDSNGNRNSGGFDLSFSGLLWKFAFGVSAVSSFVMLLNAIDEMKSRAIPGDAKHVNFDTFIRKYLGQTQKIVLVKGKKKAVGTLREGAIIDGQPAKSGHIVFDFSESWTELNDAVRREEAKKSIAPWQGVEIKTFFNFGEEKFYSILLNLPLLALILGNEAPNWRAATVAQPLLVCCVVIKKEIEKVSDSVDEKAIPADAPQVDFDTFAKEYLRKGEVEKMSYIIGTGKAVATLRGGAVIDGQTAECGRVVVNYPLLHSNNRGILRFFIEGVEKVEDEMGIPLSQRLQIELVNPMWGWRWLVNLCHYLTLYCGLRSVYETAEKVPIGRIRAFGRKAKIVSLIVAVASTQELFKLLLARFAKGEDNSSSPEMMGEAKLIPTHHFVTMSV